MTPFLMTEQIAFWMLLPVVGILMLAYFRFLSRAPGMKTIMDTLTCPRPSMTNEEFLRRGRIWEQTRRI